jgi:ATP-binding cassette subfamily B protein
VNASPHVAPLTPGKPIARASVGGVLSYTRATVALVWRSAPWLTVGWAALTLVAAVLPLGIAYAGKRIVDAVVARSRDATLEWVLLELAVVAAMALVQRGQGLTRTVLGARLGVDINVAILEKALGLELAQFEDSEFYDQLTRARREASSRPVQLVGDAFQLAQSALTLVGYAGLLVRFSGWAVVALVVATVPAAVAEARYSKVTYRLRNWRSPDSRRLMYLEYVLANDEHAKEVKLFGLGPLLLGRYKTLAETFYAEDRDLSVRRALVTHVLSLLGTTAFYGSYAMMALAAAMGRITLGNMTMYVVAFRQGQQSFQSVLGAIGSIYEHNLYMSNLFGFLAIPSTSTSTTTTTATPTPTSNGPLPKGLRLHNVGFRYPGTDRWALRNVNLSLSPGESLALVGENGAGKTTLIKLVTRLYEPTEGSITLDGRDLRDWDRAELLTRFGVLFQDFNQYQFKLRDNVAIGSVPHLDDDARIDRAVERGGAREVVLALAGGLDAPLGHWFKDGTELSGGQWQKVALARAFMREEADILVLDEPTAALDAEAEHAVFQRFHELAKGRTTIVISHRFPTVRMADRIVVLEKGLVTEEGTHAELVAKGGRYARMFALQAEGYR